MERIVARDSSEVLFAPSEGEVISATRDQIALRDNEGIGHTFPLMEFVRTNQGTCISQHPIVSKGEKVRRGQVLTDSSAINQGELALGQNVLCAFMSGEGYNFEDAVIISESLVREDKFTSIHIEKYEVEAQNTKLGPEEITRDIPDVGEEGLRNLDENGSIHIGAEVDSGDILVGKITPKGEVELTAEEKLLRAIFGEKAHEVKDTSLRVPHGEGGTVIEVKVFSSSNYDELPNGVNELVQVWVAQKRKITVGDKLSGRHGNKGVLSRILPVEDMPFLPDGTPVEIILNPIGVPSRMNLGQILETHLGWAAKILGFEAVCPVFEGASDFEIESALARAWIVWRAGAIDPFWNDSGDSPPLRLDVAKRWLAAQGYDEERIFDDNYPSEARMACLRLWLKDMGIESKGLNDEEVMEWVGKIPKERGVSPPIYGKVTLYDGRSGEPFDQPVTLGYIYMMKLIHLVEDKVHARSIGPYSLVTQQPLGGKAQFGGQRFGEMEVWALEAYGAANVLQEILTVKSDDVTGRAKAYEAITRGEDIPPPGLPQSFNVLIKELQSLGLAVELLKEEKGA
jgi:DNA-directed RNA polymerase subunit beta